MNKPALYLALLILVAGLAAGVYYTWERPLEVYNVIQAVLYYDTAHDGNRFLSGWYLPSYNYLFTEYLVHFVMSPFSEPSQFTVRLGAFVIFLSVAACVFVLSRRHFGAEAAVFGLAAFFSSPVHHFLWPNYHNAVVLHASLGLILLLAVFERAGSPSGGKAAALNMSALFLLTLLTAFSDPLFVVIFVLPALVSAPLFEFLYKRKLLPPKAGAALAALLISGAVLGILLEDLAIHAGVNMKVVATGVIPPGASFRSELLKTLTDFASMLGMDVGNINTPLSAASKAVNLALFTLVFVAVFRRLRRRAGGPGEFVLIFLAVMSAALFAAYVFNSTKRTYYLSSLYVAYAAALGVALIDVLGKGPRPLAVLSVALFAISAGNNIYNTFGDGLIKEERAVYRKAESVARLLEENGLRYGYGNFHDSHLITFLTGDRVRVRAVSFQSRVIEPYLWYTNLRWYRPTYYEGPTFLIFEDGEAGEGFETMEPYMIRRMFGEPSSVLETDGVKVFVWDYNIIRRYWETVELGEKMQRM